MMRNLKYLLAIVFLRLGYIQAQSTDAVDCNAILSTIMVPNLTGDLYQEMDNGIGSQYYIKEWLPGDIYLTNNAVVRDKFIRFNLYYNKLMWFTPLDHKQIMLDKEQIQGFSIDFGQKHFFQKITIKPELVFDSLKVYAETLYEDRISLFVYRKVVQAGYEVDKQRSKTVYKMVTSYYLMLENGRTIGMKKYSKRNILLVFPEQKEQILAKFKAEKIRHFRRLPDLIRTTQALNEVL